MDLGYWSCGRSEDPRFHRGNDLSDLPFPSPDLFTLVEIAVSPSGGDLELLNLFLSDSQHCCKGRHFDILQKTSPKLYIELNQASWEVSRRNEDSELLNNFYSDIKDGQALNNHIDIFRTTYFFHTI